MWCLSARSSPDVQFSVVTDFLRKKWVGSVFQLPCCQTWFQVESFGMLSEMHIGCRDTNPTRQAHLDYVLCVLRGSHLNGCTSCLAARPLSTTTAALTTLFVSGVGPLWLCCHACTARVRSQHRPVTTPTTLSPYRFRRRAVGQIATRCVSPPPPETQHSCRVCSCPLVGWKIDREYETAGDVLARRNETNRNNIRRKNIRNYARNYMMWIVLQDQSIVVAAPFTLSLTHYSGIVVAAPFASHLHSLSLSHIRKHSHCSGIVVAAPIASSPPRTYSLTCTHSHCIYPLCYVPTYVFDASLFNPTPNLTVVLLCHIELPSAFKLIIQTAKDCKYITHNN